MILAAAALLALPMPQTTYTGGPPLGTRSKALRRPFVTWVTGETPGADVIFEVTFDPRFAGSAEVEIAVVDPRGSLDGIDFVPGLPEVVVGMPMGKISHYDLVTGAVLPDFIPFTDVVAVPPGSPGTHPSTTWSTPSHFYYIENQFGFGGTISHRIMRKPWGGGPEEVVYDGAAHGLINFEGIESFDDRLYFFTEDPFMPTSRALVSIDLVGGLWGGMPPIIHLGGLFEGALASDGSDELDFDPAMGVIFGTNIVNGEIIAWDPIFGVELVSPGSAHFVDGAQIAGSAGALSALGGAIDGVRSIGNGWLLFTGKAGVIVSLYAPGVMADGADDGDARVLFAGAGISFDDLTPVLPNP